MLLSQKIKSFPTQKVISEDLVLIFKKNPGAYKLTIIITKKIAPRAVDRNRIKRLLKEALRQLNRPQGEVKIIAKSNMSGLKMEDVLKKLEPLFTRIK